jgi:ubiquitin carboxyl-terminal hydrolase 7
LDLDRDDGKYLSPDADRSVRNLYTLHRYNSSISTPLAYIVLFYYSEKIAGY